MLRHFLDFRFETVKRRFEYELEQLRKRIHILTGFKIVFNDLDKAIKIIRESSGRPDAAEKLMKVFKLDEIQTDAILDAQLYRLAQLEIKRILDELKEKKAQAEEIEAILASKKRLWTVVKKELGELGEKFGSKRRTKLALGEETPEFNEEAYISRENTNVVLTRDGWIKRVGKLASVEGTRVREGDEVIAVAPGSTLDHVVFLADDGSAYTMRINEVPSSSGYGEPLAKFFRLGDQVKIVNAITCDERFTPPLQVPASGRKKKQDPEEIDEPLPPYLLVVTAFGQVIRTPLEPYRIESTKAGRRYARLNEGDRVVMVQVLRDEDKTIFLASKDGHVIHFAIEEINILSGVGKGVMGIKLNEDDTCLGGAVIRNQNDALVVETSGGKTMEFFGSREVVSRGGKGIEAVKRTDFVRVVPAAITLVNWEELEGKTEEKNGKHEGNGKKGLFD
jgi:DNA gyrase subunit A